MIESFVLTVGLLLGVPQAVSFGISQRSRTAFPLHSTTSTIRPLSTPQAQDDLKEIYSLIASKDPEWLKEFVLDILEEDEDVLFILAETNQKPKKQASQKVSASQVENAQNKTITTREFRKETDAKLASTKNITHPIIEQNNNNETLQSIDKMMMLRKNSSNNTLDRKSKNMKQDSSQALNRKPTFTNSTTIKEKPLAFNLFAPNVTASNTSQAVNRNEPLPAVAKKGLNSSSAVESIQNDNASFSKKALFSKSDLQKEAQNATASNTSQAVNSSKPLPGTVKKGLNSSSAVESIQNDNASFSKKALFSKSDLQKEAQNATASNTSQAVNSSKPLPGTVKKGLNSSSAVESIQNDNPSFSKKALFIKSDLQKEAQNATASNSSQAVNSSKPLPAIVKKGLNSSSAVESIQNDNASFRNESSVKSASAMKATEVDSGREKIVVFSDSRLKKSQKVRLSKLISLGYSVDDILSLDPDALSLIVEDTLRRPSTGVPTSWKNDKKLIQIVTSDDLADFESTGSNISIPEQLDSKAAVNITSPENDGMSRRRVSRTKERRVLPEEPAQQTPLNNRGQRSKTVKEEPAAQESRASEVKKQNRRIFTGRPEPNPPRDDPPPPRAFWPDIETFRSLLRKEASLRLRILGDGWTQTVKDESEWRLDLYKNWLWTLHTGVGDPLVESRSDRMRRSSRELSKTKGKTKDAPSSNNTQRRRRRDE